jgi:hypothetical protein
MRTSACGRFESQSGRSGAHECADVFGLITRRSQVRIPPPLSLRRLTRACSRAVGDEHGPGDKAGRVAGEVYERCPEFFRQRRPLYRRIFDPVAPGQLVHGGLGGVVCRLHLQAIDDHARDRADVDDPTAAPLDQLRADDPITTPQAVDVHLPDATSLVVWHLEGRSAKTAPALLTRTSIGPSFAETVRSISASGNSTQMGFEADDLEATLTELRARGVVFERFEMPGFDVRDDTIAAPDNYQRRARANWARSSMTVRATSSGSPNRSARR